MQIYENLFYAATAGINAVLIFPTLKRLYKRFYIGKVEPTHYAFFDIEADGKPLGRIELSLFGNEAPKTVNNFLAFATGDYDRLYNYKGTKLHRIIPKYLIQGGDFLNYDGTGNATVYNTPYFEDEKNKFAFNEPFMLAMANKGPNTNGCQFFITTDDLPFLNGDYVIFGQVSKNTDLLKDLEQEYGSDDGTPQGEVIISNSGAYKFPSRKVRPHPALSGFKAERISDRKN